MQMTLDEMLELEAKCYVIMAEVNYELRKWYQRHYSPSLEWKRVCITMGYDIKRALERGIESCRDTSDAIQKATTRMSKLSN